MECEISENNDTNSSNDVSVFTRNFQKDSSGEKHNDNNELDSKTNTSNELKTPSDKQLNRRYSHRPRKCISKDVVGCHLKKVMKRVSSKSNNNNNKLPQNLETIFEEPIVTKSGELLLIGLSKAKRSITFSQFVSKTKLKKRKIKAKKLRELAEKKKMEDVEEKLWKLGL
ncbi:hypothetical protein O3M35_010911 [Rhynocoris fuscipes]|uniref:Tantalus-like domain-containing protein n=1 Tax=Rhynocoris fuscipes TaxID=488301 RepID=A0AAW1D3U9_9HEMI